MELKDVKLMHPEKIQLAKIGIDNDNYLMYAIKEKKTDLLPYLIFDVGRFDFSYKNSSGNTVLHLAVRSGLWQIVKCVLIQEWKEGVLKSKDVDDIVGNVNR